MKSKVLALTLFSALFFGCTKPGILNDITSPEALHSRAVGASANELLSDEKYKSIKIEVQYMTGFAPDAAALEHLQGLLSSYVNKPSGIIINTKEISSSAAASTTEDIISIEKNNRSVFSGSDQISIYILYTNSQYTDSKVLGIAYRNTSAALFGKKIRENSGGIGQVSRTKLEATVLAHEIGHLLGLVDLGTPMQTAHKDDGHGSHCNNNNCLMYYASETTDILGFLLTGSIPSLDAACVADLQANSGR